VILAALAFAYPYSEAPVLNPITVPSICLVMSE